MISEVIRSSIETKLNTNSKGQRFQVGSYAYLEDQQADFIYTIRGGYQLIVKDYIAVMMDFSAEYEPIPSVLSGYATISLTFLLNAENQDIFDNQLKATEEIVEKLVGLHETLTDNDKSFSSVWNIDGLIPTGQTRPINGIYYTQITTNVYVDFSDTFYFGNRYTYKLGLTENRTTEIKPYLGEVQRINTENYPHRTADNEARGGVDESAWGIQMTIYVNDFIETNILNDLSSNNYDPHKLFYYQELIDGTVKNEFWCFIKTAIKPILLGEKQYISLHLLKSDLEGEKGGEEE